MTEGQLALLTDQVDAGQVEVEETEDAWVIRDSIAMREGVFNAVETPDGQVLEGVYRPADELRSSFAMLDNVPIGFEHPPKDLAGGLVVPYPDAVLGWATNPRWDADERAIVYDAHLLRRVDVPGRETTGAVVRANTELVSLLQDGAPLETSPGALTRIVPSEGEFEGDAFEAVARDVSWAHIAVTGGPACTWMDGCGLGRAQVEDEDTAMETEITDSTSCSCSDDDPCECSSPGLLDRLKQRLTGGGTSQPPSEPRGSTMEENDDDEQPSEGLRDAAQEGLLDNIGGLLDDRLTPLKDEITQIKDDLGGRVDDLEQRQAARDEERLETKRDTLAQLRSLSDEDREALDAYPEEAIDNELELESERRRTADDYAPGNPSPQPDPSEPVGGMIQTPHGFTVTDFDEFEENPQTQDGEA